jgi:hypothetical protein
MKRYVTDEWGDGDSVEVVEIRSGEQIVVQALEPEPTTPNGQTIRLTLWTKNGPAQIWHVTFPLGMKVDLPFEGPIRMVEVEWLP